VILNGRKIAATRLGETGGDALSTLDLGYAVSTAILLGLPYRRPRRSRRENSTPFWTGR